jgi:hypothetical protein
MKWYTVLLSVRADATPPQVVVLPRLASPQTDCNVQAASHSTITSKSGGGAGEGSMPITSDPSIQGRAWQGLVETFNVPAAACQCQPLLSTPAAAAAAVNWEQEQVAWWPLSHAQPPRPHSDRATQTPNGYPAPASGIGSKAPQPGNLGIDSFYFTGSVRVTFLTAR